MRAALRIVEDEHLREEDDEEEEEEEEGEEEEEEEEPIEAVAEFEFRFRSFRACSAPNGSRE
jgi:CO dehydrogenase/acetyl-CoA synthase beta subunit